jgi:hypothetical protein
MAAKDGWWGGRAEVPRYLQRPNRPSAWRPCPPDFRETYIKEGWACEYVYGARSEVIRRWIDECGGAELVAARREYFVKNRLGKSRVRAKHVKGWSAEKLEEHHRAMADRDR